MKLLSNDFKDNQNIPAKFTCDGENISPHLAWAEIPEGTKSFALSYNDPDAPAGDWVHWLIINIPQNVNEIIQGQTAGEEIENDFGKKEYGGPCPPSGAHHYVFTVYALNDEKLENISKENFKEIIKDNLIESAKLTGLYERQ